MNSKIGLKQLLMILCVIMISTFTIGLFNESSVKADSMTYRIKINRLQNCITIYKADQNGEYTIAVKAMVCSCALDTEKLPIGIYTITSRNASQMNADSQVNKYVVNLNNGTTVNSVPYLNEQDNSLIMDEFNKLGESVTTGDVRINTGDAKWIFDNCVEGTEVEIYDDNSTPGPLGKPDTIKIPAGNEYASWDPTNDVADNPWKQKQPVIEGARSRTVYISENIDVYDGITAKDTCGNDITEDVYVVGEYNLQKEGDYTITYCVEDAIGASTSVDCRIVVKQDDSNKDTTGSSQNASANSDVMTEKITALIAFCIIASFITFFIVKSAKKD